MAKWLRIEDAVQLLDVDLRHVLGWYGGITQSQFFRVPGFAAYFTQWERSSSERETFDSRFLVEATKIATHLSRQGNPTNWCEDSFNQRQLDMVLRDRPMRFDKAVVAVLALDAFGKTLKPAQTFDPLHSVVCCAFRISALKEYFDRAADDAGGALAPHAQDVVYRHLQTSTGQSRLFLERLVHGVKSPSGRTTNVTASYATLRKTYFALRKFPSLAHLQLEPRSNLIELRLRGDPIATAVREERVLAGRVDRPPYGFEPLDGTFPPKDPAPEVNFAK
jgi:hypothetical protein